MKEISLSQGKVTLVDDADYDWLTTWRWHVAKDRCGNLYARRYVYEGKDLFTGKDVMHWIHMHRAILDPPEGYEVDHRDRNTLNNQRHNLRSATRSQNAANVMSFSGYKGAYWHKTQGCWTAQIRVKSKLKHLGNFKTEVEAALAYNKAATKHFGEFACLNQIT